MPYDEEKIKLSIFESMKVLEISNENARDIAFHMTDWLGDLKALQEYYADPETFSNEEASDLLMHFLVHVPDHIAAAKKLACGFPVTDVFEIGALSEN
jgi:hypothetical protein